MKAFGAQPVEVDESWNNRLKTVPLAFEIALGKLAPGKYDRQVTVVNPVGEKAAPGAV